MCIRDREGSLIKYADRIAYLCHDYDDAESMGLISADKLPERVRRVLGTTHSSMITAMVEDLVANSADQDSIHTVSYTHLKKNIKLKNPIKTTGEYDVEVWIHQNVTSEVHISVVAE